MDPVLLRFANLLAWGTLCVFGLRAVLLFVGAVRYQDPHFPLRLLDSFNGVRRTFPWVQNTMYALIAAAWLLASHAL